MGSFWQALGLSSGSGNGGGQDRPADLPPERSRKVPKTEKEAIRKHVEEQERQQREEDEGGGERSGRII